MLCVWERNLGSPFAEDTLPLFCMDLRRVRLVFEFFFRNLVASSSLGVVVDFPVKDNR